MSRRPVALATLAALWGAALGLIAPSAAHAQAAQTELYAVNNSTTLSVVTNKATGTTAAIATLAFATKALARDSATQRVYYVSSATPAQVAYFDPFTNSNTIINSTGTGLAGEKIERMTYRAGVLYAISDSAHGSRLFTINPATGVYSTTVSVRVGAGGPIFSDNGDLAWNAAGTVLYATSNAVANAQGNSSGGGTAVFTINTATGVATQLGDFGPVPAHTALAFAGGVLYSAGAAGQLYIVNTGAGSGAASGTASAYQYQDFAAGPTVADLQLSMSASGTFAIGTNATYALTVSNNGPYAATASLSLVDTLPTGFTYVSGTGTGWGCAAVGRVVTCTNASGIAIAGSAPVLSIVALNVSALGSVTNIARAVSTTTADQNYVNNRATSTNTVAVYGVTTTPDADTVSRLPSNGTTYSKVFVVTNSGGLPSNYNLAATVAPAGVVTIVSVNGVNGTTGTTGSLVAGASANVTVVYTVATAAATGAAAALTLTATSAVLGSVSDAGDLTVTVIRANLTMAKVLYRDDKATLVTTGVSPGEYVQYKVTITNSGAAGAITVNVSDPVPSQVTYVSNTPDAAGWTITAPPTTTITASLAGTLAAGASRYFWIRVRVQ